MRFHQGNEKELNHCEREQHQNEQRAREQDDQGEDPAQVGPEGNVAKAERRHGHQRPVDRGRPRMGLSLARHQIVKSDAEDRQQNHEHDEQPSEHLQVSLLFQVR